VSERKTTEIKLRVSPEEKTSWQLAAEQREVGLSQFIRDCVQESVWAEQNQRMDGLALVDNAIESLRERGAGESAAVAHLESFKAGSYEIPVVVDANVPPGFAVIKNLTDAQGDSVAEPTSWEPFTASKDYIYDVNTGEVISVTVVPRAAQGSDAEVEDSSVAQAVPTSGEAGLVAKPWMFEARSGD